jgi:hypothetical protein
MPVQTTRPPEIGWPSVVLYAPIDSSVRRSGRPGQATQLRCGFETTPLITPQRYFSFGFDVRCQPGTIRVLCRCRRNRAGCCGRSGVRLLQDRLRPVRITRAPRTHHCPAQARCEPYSTRCTLLHQEPTSLRSRVTRERCAPKSVVRSCRKGDNMTINTSHPMKLNLGS